MLEVTTLESGNRRETKRFEKKTNNKGMKSYCEWSPDPNGLGERQAIMRAIPIDADEERSARTRSTISLQPQKELAARNSTSLAGDHLGGKPRTSFI